VTDPIEQTADSRAEVLAAIRRFVVLEFRDGRSEGLAADTPLVTSGIVDSAGILHLIDWLEQTFAIRIEDEAVSAENFDTLEALARLVVARA
jgi:acyl carrier protein